MSMTLLEWIELKARAEKIDAPTKKDFGKLMHDATVSEEEKQEILKKVAMAGGYDNLA